MAKSYPPWLKKRYRRYWDQPWLRRAFSSYGFRKQLNDNDYLTPHFRVAEARCKDGTQLPKKLRRRARNHAFRLERLRHALGDKPIPTISWYRTWPYNNRIGGASKSQHPNGIATDHPKQWVNARGRKRVLALANKIWHNGGVGVYPAGSVHFDSRGWRARWRTY